LDDILEIEAPEMADRLRETITQSVHSFSSKQLNTFYKVLTDENEYIRQSNIFDEEFLKKLTKLELMGILDEADYANVHGGDKWRDALKAKKPELIKTILATTFDQMFIPQIFIPQKPEHFNKAVG